MAKYLPDFQGVYLEDSYFLGLVAERRNLRARMLFVLREEHPSFATPPSSEQRCYREGSLLATNAVVIEWTAGKPTIHTDPDGTFDFEGLKLFEESPTRFRLVTEWFDVVLETAALSVEIP